MKKTILALLALTFAAPPVSSQVIKTVNGDTLTMFEGKKGELPKLFITVDGDPVHTIYYWVSDVAHKHVDGDKMAKAYTPFCPNCLLPTDSYCTPGEKGRCAFPSLRLPEKKRQKLLKKLNKKKKK